MRRFWTMENKVTVVIPVYNTKKYLEKCVDSITGQTFQNIEILLIDDGSTDGSAELCDELGEKDDRIRVIHKQNGGAATARNLGMDIAQGKYIMFIDSDDWLDSDAVETLVEHADENNVDVIRFGYVREFEDKQLVKRNTFLEERVYLDDECLDVCRQILGLTGKELAYPENMNYLASCGFNMYKKELLQKSGVRFTPIRKIGAFVDGLFNFCVFMNVKRFEFIDKPYYHYRKTNETAATARYRVNYINRQIILFEILKSEAEKSSMWEFFKEAYNNRIVLCTMEIVFNALRNKTSYYEKYKEIRCVLMNECFKKAYKQFDLKYMGLKWKIYYFFIKHSMTLPTYMLSEIILKIKNRGIL